ncbi:MAG: ferritin-like domain-containing protein [Pseudomonadota bacterium]|jgi:rubrerythrin|nr:MAG: ferritin Dps family protein [Pseudomonadota bacterium]
MQPTTTGQNRTGAAVHPAGISRMLEAVEELSPQVPISTAPIEAERLRNIAEADSIGSIPPPASLVKGAVKKGMSMLRGVNPGLFMDKIGERIAFERTGTRLYDALISKYLTLSEAGGEELPPLDTVAIDDEEEGEPVLAPASETPLDTLRRIRSEELGHFRMLCEVMGQLGGDPTAQTPCADVTATATMGVLQVVTDPRTTLAQCLNAMLVAELADTASWELLADLATRAGQAELADRFTEAMMAEEQHVVAVRAWLRALTVDAAGTPAV